MESNKHSVYAILERHVHSYALQGYVTGIINEAGDRLYAFTFNRLTPEDADEVWNIQHGNNGHTSYGVAPAKPIDATSGGWSACAPGKSIEDNIREGVYRAYATKFFGCLFEGAWYILREVAYLGEHISDESAREMLEQGVEDRSVLNHSVYLPMEEYFPRGNPDAKKHRRSVETLEFLGNPTLVAYMRQEAKEQLNVAFTHFFNLAYFLPFTVRLKAAMLDDYVEFYPTRASDFTLIFPASRDYILIPANVRDAQQKYSLRYFFWHAKEEKMYEWTYFSAEKYSSIIFVGFNIVENLSTLCHWNDISYLDSSCTLDDDQFWNNHVLAKEDGKYKYLKDPMPV